MPAPIEHVGFGVSETGYPYWSVRDPDKTKTVTVHQLLAIADGADPHRVFADGTEVHHDVPHKLANLPGFLSVLSTPEHRRTHAADEWEERRGYPVLELSDSR